jgi:hypothetical protein
VNLHVKNVKKEGGVVNDELGGDPIVVFAGPADDGFTMAAYRRTTTAGVLSFSREGSQFVDAETGSRWTIEGKCEEGSLRGTQLAPLHFSQVRWHAWIYSHPGSELWISLRQEPVGINEGVFAPLLAGRL